MKSIIDRLSIDWKIMHHVVVDNLEETLSCNTNSVLHLSCICARWDQEYKHEVKPFRNISNTCRQIEEGDCPFKTKHTWKECPNNPWGINKGKSCDSSGAMIMCTVGYFDAVLNLTPNDAMVYITHTDDNLNKPEVVL